MRTQLSHLFRCDYRNIVLHIHASTYNSKQFHIALRCEPLTSLYERTGRFGVGRRGVCGARAITSNDKRLSPARLYGFCFGCLVCVSSVWLCVDAIWRYMTQTLLDYVVPLANISGRPPAGMNARGGYARSLGQGIYTPQEGRVHTRLVMGITWIRLGLESHMCDSGPSADAICARAYLIRQSGKSYKFRMCAQSSIKFGCFVFAHQLNRFYVVS